jgi:AraC family transcriptional regulator of adaptative response/methylated-DNA-[protein]-cysteine methyltransferase
MDHGVASLAGFQEAFGRLFGGGSETPGLQAAWFATPLGPMVGAASEAGVCFLEFSDRQRLESQVVTLGRRFGPGVVPGDSRHLARLRTELDAYFAGRLREFSVPLVYPGTPFEVRVWEALRTIGYGATRSYLDIARSLGDPGAMRAVGGANGRNRIAVVIPCHRVVNHGGRGLGGYGGGLWRKERLLALEQGQGALMGGPPPS